MFIISQPCSLGLCLYKVKRGNFAFRYQILINIIHKAPRIYTTNHLYKSTWSVQCIIQLCFEIGDFLNLDNALGFTINL